MLVELFHSQPLIIGPEVYPKLQLAIDRPHEIGTDLVANAVAGYAKCQTTCIIVDFGTALTFTTVAKTGQILGVAIAPGLKTAMYSLFKSTAQLPVVPLEVPESAIGKNTAHALQAGVLLGYIGLVETLVGRIQKELNEKCYVVATGGLSSIIPELRTVFDEIDPNLTLDGLRIMAEYHFSK
jgi:type III pantothenate kinase